MPEIVTTNVSLQTVQAKKLAKPPTIANCKERTALAMLNKPQATKPTSIVKNSQSNPKL